jgi:hypothetical protein
MPLNNTENSVATLEKTHYVSIVRKKWLIHSLGGEDIIAGNSENYTKPVNTLNGQEQILQLNQVVYIVTTEL